MPLVCLFFYQSILLCSPCVRQKTKTFKNYWNEFFTGQMPMPATGFMASVTCGLTAEDRDQLWDPTLVPSILPEAKPAAQPTGFPTGIQCNS